MIETQVRRLKAEDVDAIGAILASITQEPVNPDFHDVIDAQVRSVGDANFVAEYQGRLVGYMISYILSGSFGIEKSAWIAMLGVDPEFMGQGIGKRLAEETFKFFKVEGLKNIFTSVKWDSTDLLSFFKTLGFNRSEFINLHKSID